MARSVRKARAASRKQPRIKTNQAVEVMTEEDRREAIERIALGDSWKSLEKEISGRLKGYEAHEPIVQSTQRALELVRNMTFDKLGR